MTEAAARRALRPADVVRLAIVIALAPVLVSRPVWAADASGASGALALAALVAENSPIVSAGNRQMLATLFSGSTAVGSAKGSKIAVYADKAVCSFSNADITRHACNLIFGRKTVTLAGRKAHELFATLVEVGVPPDGAAGTIYEGVSKLTCTVDVDAVKQRDGEGASCHFDTGAI